MKDYILLPAGHHTTAEVVRLRRAQGAAGYGVYIMLLELLRAAPDYQLTQDFGALAWALHIDEDLTRAVICDFSLFELKENSFSCSWMTATMRAAEEQRERRAERARTAAMVKHKQNNGEHKQSTSRADADL